MSVLASTTPVLDTPRSAPHTDTASPPHTDTSHIQTTRVSPDTTTIIATTTTTITTQQPIVKNDTGSAGPIGTSLRERIKENRRIVAEDPDWNLAPVPSLSELCVNLIVRNFEQSPNLAGIPPKHRQTIISKISPALPLSLASPLIPDDQYWRRRAANHFHLASVSAHNNSWKQLFFELHVCKIVQDFVPGRAHNDLDDLVKDLDLAAPFVCALNLAQLRPGVQKSGDAEKSIAGGAGSDTGCGVDGPKGLVHVMEHPKGATNAYASMHPDHIDLALVLSRLTRLKHLSLYFGVQDCGINFSWTHFGATLKDCTRLASYLASPLCTLTRLSITRSSIDDTMCRELCESVRACAALEYLDLSHNKICDKSTDALASIVTAHSTTTPSSSSSIHTLVLANNHISSRGATTLFTSPLHPRVKALCLRLNAIGDAGVFAACKCVAGSIGGGSTKDGGIIAGGGGGNQGVCELDLCGVGATSVCVSAICALIKRNLPSLNTINLACNKLGSHTASANGGGGATGGGNESSGTTEPGLFGGTDTNVDGDVVGKAIFEAVSQNKYLLTLDLRSTDISPEFAVAIQSIIAENSAP